MISVSGKKKVTGLSIVASFVATANLIRVLPLQSSALECLRRPLDHIVAACPPGRFAPCLALSQSYRSMGTDPTRPGDDCTVYVDVHEQMDQVAGPLYSISGRCVFAARVYPIWLFPRRHQDVRGDDSQCGKLYSIFSFKKQKKENLLEGGSMEKSRSKKRKKVVVGCGLSPFPLTRQPSQRFDHDSSFMQPPSLTHCVFSVRASFLFPFCYFSGHTWL